MIQTLGGTATSLARRARVTGRVPTACAAIISLFGCGGKGEADSDRLDLPVTARVLAENAGSYRDESTSELVRIGRNGWFALHRVERVGGGDAEIPAATRCGTVIEGPIREISLRSLSERERELSYATHELKVHVVEVRLSDVVHTGSVTSASCQAALGRMRQAWQGGERVLRAEISSSDTIRLHLRGGPSSTTGAPRNASTLDETFTRFAP